MTRETGRKASARAGPRTASGRRGSTSGFVPIYVPFLFLIPALLLLIVFRYFPTISAIYHSFTVWEIPQPRGSSSVCKTIAPCLKIRSF